MKGLKVCRKNRNADGQALALPMVMLALMVIVVVGFFSFEVARTASARDQLRSATEAAALAGAATLASSSADIITAQGNALSAAKGVFKQNDIFGVPLTNIGTTATGPAAGQASLTFQFLDPTNNNAPVAQGDPKGHALQITSVYGLPSLAGKLVGLGDGPISLSAQSSGGVGEIDVVLCFDCSGSMRFNTVESKVRRTWDDVANKIKYVVVATPNSLNLAGGMRPQQITGLNASLRGANDNSLPGNFPPGHATDAGFTDLVVNFDEQKNFSGFQDGTFSFPNVAALVEASRGNLESDAVFQSSGAATTLQGLVTPQAGYQAKYFELARKHTHPFNEAVTAGQNFFNLMNTNTKAHFGFVAFRDDAGQTETTTFQDDNVGDNYPTGGVGNFPLPAISLDAAEGQTNADKVSTALGGVVPDGGTNIGASIDRAAHMFDTGSRPNAKKAIILFTDGVPNKGLPLDASPIGNCQKAAQECHNKGIAVFAVGLALDPGEFQEQSNVLNLITTTAGNGGKFFQVTDPSKLNGAFGSIARNLTSIVQ